MFLKQTSTLKKNPYVLIYFFQQTPERKSFRISRQIKMLEVHGMKPPRNPALAELEFCLASRNSRIHVFCVPWSQPFLTAAAVGLVSWVCLCHSSPVLRLCCKWSSEEGKDAEFPDLEYLQEPWLWFGTLGLGLCVEVNVCEASIKLGCELLVLQELTALLLTCWVSRANTGRRTGEFGP